MVSTTFKRQSLIIKSVTLSFLIVAINVSAYVTSSISVRPMLLVTMRSNGFSARSRSSTHPPFRTRSSPSHEPRIKSTNANDSEEVQYKTSFDPFLDSASLTLRRASWISWWAQLILTTVSSVTLLFARSVMDTRPITNRTLLPGTFLLAGTGIGLSILSIVWTWGSGARLSRRLNLRSAPLNKQNHASYGITSRIKAANLIRNVVRIGVTLNMLGILMTLIGAEQIIGLLAARVLTTATTASVGVVAGTTQVLQPLDILVVQANTNTLLSHFVSLACTLYLTRCVHHLDPPSVEDDNKLK